MATDSPTPHSDKRPWRTIAQELAGEQDASRTTELSTELLAAMDDQEPALKQRSRIRLKREAKLLGVDYLSPGCFPLADCPRTRQSLPFPTCRCPAFIAEQACSVCSPF